MLARREQEEDYHPGNYACTVFGDPQRPPWGWRLECHHLSLNFTVAGDGRLSATPAFTGANPAHVHDGPLQGLRVLGAEQDLAFALLHGLADGQRRWAVIAAQSPGDIVTGPLRRQTLERPVGVSLRELDGTLKSRAERLIDAYLDNLRADFAAALRRRLAEAGLEAVHFAWAGSHEPGRLHYYRLHGPRLLIEYDNTQDNANHIHAVCHDPKNDFGLDLAGAALPRRPCPRLIPQCSGAGRSQAASWLTCTPSRPLSARFWAACSARWRFCGPSSVAGGSGGGYQQDDDHVHQNSFKT